MSRETQIRRDRQGNWRDGDDLIEHPGVTNAFHRWVRVVQENGRYCLQNSLHWVYVDIEGPAFFVTSVSKLDEPVPELEIRGGTVFPWDPQTLFVDQAGHLFVEVLEGLGWITDSALLQLSPYLEEQGGTIGLRLKDKFIVPQVITQSM